MALKDWKKARLAEISGSKKWINKKKSFILKIFQRTPELWCVRIIDLKSKPTPLRNMVQECFPDKRKILKIAKSWMKKY